MISVGSADEGLVLWASEPLRPERQFKLATIRGTIRAWNLNLSHEGSQVALVVTEGTTYSRSGKLLTANLRTGAVRHLASNIELGRYLNYPVWSPDGRSVAVLRQSQWQAPYEQQIVVIDVQSGGETILATAQIRSDSDDTALQLYPLAWSPDSTALYAQQGLVGAVELLRIEQPSGKVKRRGRITEQGLPRCYFASFDGKRLLWMNGSADLRTYALTLLPLEGQAAPTRLLTVDGNLFSDPLWSPDGRRIALGATEVGASQSTPVVVEVQSGDVAPVPLDRNIMGRSFWYPVAWSPAEDWLILTTSETKAHYLLANIQRPIALPLTLPEATTLVGWVEQSAIFGP